VDELLELLKLPDGRRLFRQAAGLPLLPYRTGRLASAPWVRAPGSRPMGLRPALESRPLQRDDPVPELLVAVENAIDRCTEVRSCRNES
jgi:hypothetical protein